MRRKPRGDSLTPGQDSFLDIVANLVGILIILVMVVGARAKDVWSQPASASAPSELAELEQAVQSSAETTEALRSDIQATSQKVKLQEAAVKVRKTERDQLQTFLSSVERELEARKSQLDSADQLTLDMRRDIEQAKNALIDLSRQQMIVENSTAPPTVIEHIPTPMAKTVFGKEVHFRLLHSRLAYVPLNELIERMKSEIRVKAEKLRTISAVTETVGPIAGFHLRYRLHLAQRLQRTQFGEVYGKAAEFAGFHLVPTSDQLGEPLEQALQPDSQFNRRIAGLSPDRTTVTVWVYPDSFKDFLVLKRVLFQRGFLTASWPLPEGQPISGGPDGRRSAAQ